VSLVPVGEAIRLEINMDNVEEAEAKVVFYRTDTNAAVGEVTRPISGTRLSVIWPAEGPDAETERSCEVGYRVEAGDLVSEGSETFVVFHDWIEVECVDSDSAAVANVPVRLKVGDAEPVSIKTGDDGKRKQTGLAPDDYEIDIMPGYRLVSWEGNKASTKRKAKVEPCPFEVKFKWPVPADKPHRQYVNLYPIAPGLTDYGTKIKIKIERKAGDFSDTEFFFKAEFDGENHEQSTGKKYPAQDTLTYESGSVFVTKPKMSDNDSVVEVTVNLGTGGGDKVTLKIGDTEECLNDTIVIENWRRICFYTDPDLDVPGGVLEQLSGMYAKAFVECHRQGDSVMPRNDCCHEIKGNYLSKFYRDLDQRDDDGDYLILDFTPDDTASAEYKGLVAITRAMKKSSSFYGPQVAIYLIDGLYKEKRRTVNFELKNKNATKTLEAAKGWRFLEKRIANGDVFYETKCSIKVRSKDFDPAFDVTIGDDAKTVTVALAPDEKQPGGVGDYFGTIRSLHVRFDMYETQLYSGLSATTNCVFIARRPHMPNTYALTIAHELAHSIGEVAEKTTNGDLKAVDHPHYVLDRGFAGPHCSHGISGSDLDAENYLADLHDKNKRGDCVMWGAAPRGASEDGGAPTDFCEACLKHLRITKMG
jgi:hypothetical protein